MAVPVKVQEVIDMLSQLNDGELGHILMDISKRVWIPQFMTKGYLETLLDKPNMTDNEFHLIRNNTSLNDRIITFIDEETQSEYYDCCNNEK